MLGRERQHVHVATCTTCTCTCTCSRPFSLQRFSFPESGFVREARPAHGPGLLSKGLSLLAETKVRELRSVSC